jgi:hypothetical protein
MASFLGRTPWSVSCHKHTHVYGIQKNHRWQADGVWLNPAAKALDSSNVLEYHPKIQAAQD